MRSAGLDVVGQYLHVLCEVMSLIIVRVEDLFYKPSLELIEQLFVVFANKLWVFSL